MPIYKWRIITGLIIGSALAFTACTASPYSNDTLTAFAQCLANKKVTMYGAAWCSHCQEEKKLFGDSWKLVPYVECPQDAQKCLDLGIKGYPTWIFPDGHREEGKQSLEKLAVASGCPLPQ